MVDFFLKIAISGYFSIGGGGGIVGIYAPVADCTYLFTDYSYGLQVVIRWTKELYKLYLNAFNAYSYYLYILMTLFADDNYRLYILILLMAFIYH